MRMARGEKIIHDPVHGGVRLSGLVLDLIDTPELQRLRGIRQLGLAYIAFPGGNHSRFEHSLGVAHLVQRFTRETEFPSEELDLLSAAAILHDIGHPPYSHTLEYLMIEYLGKNHAELACDMVQGELSVSAEEELKTLRSLHVRTAAEVLEKHGIDAREVASLLIGKHRRPYLGQLIQSEVDLDQMDFLMRDAHFTGVALGMVDIDRLMRTLVVHRGRLAILDKGVEAVEGLLTARGLMYSSVYFHRTVRVAELMLANAVEFAISQGGAITGENFALMTDSQLIERLYATGGYPLEIVTRLRYRQLFKTAYQQGRKKISPTERRRLLKRFGKWSRLKEVQDEIADLAGVPRGYVILDAPIVDLIISEPRLQKVEIPVLGVEGKPVRLSKLSRIAAALKERLAPRYSIQIVTLPKYIGAVNRASKRILG